MSGVSATVNGVSAPIFKVSPGELTIQIPTKPEPVRRCSVSTITGKSLTYLFQIAAAAPGIFVDRGTLANPSATAQARPDGALFVTGEGDVTPALITGRPPRPPEQRNRGLPKPRLPGLGNIGGVTAATRQFRRARGTARADPNQFHGPAGCPSGCAAGGRDSVGGVPARPLTSP